MKVKMALAYLVAFTPAIVVTLYCLQKMLEMMSQVGMP